jgi:hypothetical protein
MNSLVFGMEPKIAPGAVNKNGQVVIHDTGLRGTEQSSRIIQLGCSKCGTFYGANSTHVWERLCPKCQRGKPGLPYEESTKSN